MTVVGLTGNIACGKSRVAKYLVAEGCFLVDADKIGKDIAQPGLPTYAKLREVFGADFFLADGSLNRGKLGAYVFSNPQALKTLNQIMHPEIFRQIELMVLKNLQSYPKQIVIVEAAILIESRMQEIIKNLFDYIWLVQTEDQLQLKRLMERDGIAKELALQKIHSQMPQTEKAKYADFIINNNQDLIALQLETQKALQSLRQKADN